MRIIIADDMPKVRGALQLLLNQQPALSVIGEITRPSEVISGVRALHPDLLLLDWELAGKDTLRLLSELRSLDDRLLVIALSSQPEARDAALGAGADGFISKNETPERVLDTLFSVVTRK
jgi:DNA-binding NarL/FixJ family response regulator